MRQLTTHEGDGEPQVSPNGNWIVFTRRVDLDPGREQQLWRIRPDGTQLTQITSGHFDRTPSFSRSGTRLIFARPAPSGGPADLYTIRLNGTGLHRLTNTSADERNPVFSPNGRIIAFDSFDLNGPSTMRHVKTMRIDGSNIRDLTPLAPHSTKQPDFSPNGRWIVFVRPGGNNSALFLIRPNGSKKHKLTGSREGFASPAFSPNGTRIVTQTNAYDRYSKIQVIRIRDLAWTTQWGGARFTRSPDMDDPVWQPQR